MSRTLSAQDEKNIIEIPNFGITYSAWPGVPTASIKGYGPGSWALNKSTGVWYRNTGTFSSATWAAQDGGLDLSTLTATATELNTLHNQTITTGPGAGLTDGTGTIIKSAVNKLGLIYRIKFIIDLTGVASSTTDLDIIGTGTSPAYLCQLSAAQAGATVLTVRMTCLEAPAGGVTDIDLYSATEGTGKFDDAVTGLTETALITAGGAWTNGATKGATTVPLSTEYIYICGGAAGTAATYTAGKFEIEIQGYD